MGRHPDRSHSADQLDTSEDAATDIADFISARYDEIEAAARAATAGPWSYNPNKMWLGHRDFETFDRSKGEEYVAYGESPFTGCVAATGPVDDPQSAADARHVVLHDPAYELADITAKRRILERAEFVNGHGPAVDHTRAMDMTAGASGALHDVLKFLALPFADHPGYREEWKPA